MKLKPTNNKGISMGETIEMINKHSKGDAILVSDVGDTKCLPAGMLNSTRQK
jgi:thiamine pyrophosphate-dependent acetolactate synthase large subunit-like protein